jgi:predicted XRE-type DNA-binding protein
MSKMKELYIEIEELLENTCLLTEEIAAKVGCSVSIVNDIVEHQWLNNEKSALL